MYGGELLQIFVGGAGQDAGAPYGAGSGGDPAGGTASGGSGGFGDGNDTTTGGSGGGGGAASEVDVAADPVRGTSDRVLAVAAGGGGGGGSGAIVLYNGGPAGNGGNPALGGTGGTGPGAGGAGAGGTGDQHAGAAGSSSPTFSQGGGGGGGGGGYNPLAGGGGTGGGAGGAGAGGGGGGGGGLSFAALTGATFGAAPGTGNGDVTIGWTTPATGQTLSANPNPVTVGGSFTLTDTVTSSEAAGPAPTGSVTPYRQKSTVALATAPLTPTGAGTARAVFPSMVAGAIPALSSFYAVYSGDANYPQATSDPFNESVVLSAAVADVNTSALAFGRHRVGSSSTKTVTITNDGTAPLTLNSAATTGQPFSVVQLTYAGHARPIHAICTLQPHQRATVTVRFHPATRGNFTRSLVLTDNSANSPQAVTLTGSAH